MNTLHNLLGMPSLQIHAPPPSLYSRLMPLRTTACVRRLTLGIVFALSDTLFISRVTVAVDIATESVGAKMECADGVFEPRLVRAFPLASMSNEGLCLKSAFVDPDLAKGCAAAALL